jgi:hypothetical protein
MTIDGEYERGVTAGEVAARLAGHDKHFASINGSLVKVAENGIDQTRAINALTMAVQRLTDEFAASQRTLITTAAALKDAEAARRDKMAQTWSPVQKTTTIVLAMVAIAGLVLAFIR